MWEREGSPSLNAPFYWGRNLSLERGDMLITELRLNVTALSSSRVSLWLLIRGLPGAVPSSCCVGDSFAWFSSCERWHQGWQRRSSGSPLRPAPNHKEGARVVFCVGVKHGLDHGAKPPTKPLGSSWRDGCILSSLSFSVFLPRRKVPAPRDSPAGFWTRGRKKR